MNHRPSCYAASCPRSRGTEAWAAVRELPGSPESQCLYWSGGGRARARDANFLRGRGPLGRLVL
eukprot:gene6478-biopygen5902